MSRGFRYVTHFGMLYRMSESKYREMLRDAVKNDYADPSRFGTEIDQCRNISDIDAKTARDLLEAVENAS